MNLKWLLPARSAIRPTRRRAAAGSRYSSTNFMTSPSLPLLHGARDGFGSHRRRGHQRVDLVGEDLAHHLQRCKSEVGLVLVDLRHREPDMDEHPITGHEVL